MSESHEERDERLRGEVPKLRELLGPLPWGYHWELTVGGVPRPLPPDVARRWRGQQRLLWLSGRARRAWDRLWRWIEWQVGR